jgi:hypothetical protein
MNWPDLSFISMQHGTHCQAGTVSTSPFWYAPTVSDNFTLTRPAVMILPFPGSTTAIAVPLGFPPKWKSQKTFVPALNVFMMGLDFRFKHKTAHQGSDAQGL